MHRNVAVGVVLFSTACGGSEPNVEAPKVAPTATVQAARPKPPGMVVSQEMGSIDPADVDRAVRSVQRQLFKCQELGTDRHPYMNGNLKFALRLGPDGKIKWLYLEESTLGDRETETCLLGVLQKAPWPTPIGGDGEVRKSFGFTLGGTRAPFSWSSDKIQEALGKVDGELKKCKAQKRASYRVTLYVEPDEEAKEGKVVAAGAAASERDSEASIDCIVNVLKGMKVPSPGDHAAKVSFTL